LKMTIVILKPDMYNWEVGNWLPLGTWYVMAPHQTKHPVVSILNPQYPTQELLFLMLHVSVACV
jgi:hypothetical protein